MDFVLEVSDLTLVIRHFILLILEGLFGIVDRLLCRLKCVGVCLLELLNLALNALEIIGFLLQVGLSLRET